MQKKSPYDVIQSRYVTEKTRVLEQLQYNASNPCVKKCVAPKYVFLVASRSNKREIAEAVEEIYAERNVRVTAVNTIRMKQKPRRVRGRSGWTAGYKKAIVTLEAGDSLEETA
jgi:large subunit ribosomal protein L23